MSNRSLARMRAEVLIVGQGLAGTLLAWELERAGIPFAIADRGSEGAASAAAAGIINPITGRRLVRSWRVETLLPAARTMYRGLEAAWSVSLWREMRVRRKFADDTERRVFARKYAAGELAPFVESDGDENGFWISGAARVDFGALLAAARTHWQRSERLLIGAVDPVAETQRYALAIDCRGWETALSADEWRFAPWEFSKGEMIEVRVQGLAPDVILNRRQWIVPTGAETALVGATHEPGGTNREPSVAARERLEAAARELLGSQPFSVMDHRVGVRVNLPDKRPIAGRHPSQPRLGVLNGLGAKGALWAPMLARQWANHLTQGESFDPEIDVARFSVVSRNT